MKKIFILHGWAYSTEKWEPFIKKLKSNKFEVEMLKIPGLTAPLDKVWDIDDYVEWLNKIIGQDKAVLLGHSNGGRIAIYFVDKYPGMIEKLILIDSAGIYHNELPIRLKRLLFGIAAKTGKKFGLNLTLKKLLYKLAREHDYEKANPIIQQTMRHLIRTDCSQVLKNIRIKTLIIWGGQDKITPVTDANILHKELSNSTLHIIDDARHSPMFTNPKEVSEIITKNL